jgi:hypothetical protein
MDLKDDANEAPLNFNTSIEFWEYKKLQSAVDKTWHFKPKYYYFSLRQFLSNYFAYRITLNKGQKMGFYDNDEQIAKYLNLGILRTQKAKRVRILYLSLGAF